LLVDDDPVVLRSLRRLVLAAHPRWEIDTAEGVDLALKLLELRDHDVVVTDLQMPELDGMVLLERLKSERPWVTRVIHSSHVESLAPGAAELAQIVIPKPCSARALLSALEDAFDQKHWLVRDSAGF
jgi:DNA-binding NtrC family response regulator